VFTPGARDRVRQRLLERAEADPDIVGAAITGSAAVGRDDRWSDIDLMFAVRGSLDASMARWTTMVYEHLDALHHWDLPAGPAVYRVFLLPGWLEVDIGFAPADAWGPYGESWRTVFGSPVAPPAPQAGRSDNTTGLAWHHAMHAWVCVHRGRYWQAAHWIGAVRDLVIVMACRRLGHPAGHARGAHLLPAELTAPLEAALVRSLDETELRRALGALLPCLAEELRRTDAQLAARLGPMLAQLG
jgi:hypothetical protein